MKNLKELAIRVREERKSETNTLHGYCFQNAEKMSEVLEEEGIDHELYKVGIIEDVHQYCGADFDDIYEANRTRNFVGDVPQYLDELPSEATHYVIVVEDSEKIIIEPSSELRDENFKSAYVGEWPEESYLLLEDSKINKKDMFEHY